MKKTAKIIFLDRDGVINKFPGFGNYVTQWSEFHFLPNAIRATKLLVDAGFEIAVISNQGCVARKLITKTNLSKLTRRMLNIIKKNGGRIHGVYYCYHQTSDECDCKKPKTSLFKKAIKGRQINLGSTYFIGDSEEDMQAGENLGCQKLLVLSGRLKRSNVKSLSVKPDVIKKDLWSAAQWIVKKKR